MATKTTYPEFQTAGGRIKGFRQGLRMTRKEFAEKTGIPFHTLGNIEQGKQKAHDEHFQAIARHWPNYVYWLLTGFEPDLEDLPPEVVDYLQRLKRMEETGIPDPLVERIRQQILAERNKKGE